jgi:hypothetical protein
MSFSSNGGKFKLYSVLKGLIFPTPTQPRISFERAILVRVLVLLKPENAKKDEFYETLLTEQDNLVGNKILMGDINDRVDRDNTGIERYLGPYREEAKNDNGERLIDLLITNSKFKHKDITSSPE